MAILQLCLGVLTVIQVTSSQSTYDVIQQENDVSSCGRNDQVLSELSQMKTAMSQLVTAVSQMKTVISQLQSDVQALVQQQAVTGTPESSLTLSRNQPVRGSSRPLSLF